MLKAFGLTLLFWTLFIFTNTVADAIDFYAVFPLYGRMDIWHCLKYFWIGFAVLTGWFARDLYHKVSFTMPFDRALGSQDGKIYMRTALLLFFLLYRWGLHEGLMAIWRQA